MREGTSRADLRGSFPPPLTLPASRAYPKRRAQAPHLATTRCLSTPTIPSARLTRVIIQSWALALRMRLSLELFGLELVGCLRLVTPLT